MSKKNSPILSVIVPAYKQARTIKKDLENIDRVLHQIRLNYEIICVVDGFIDNTFTNAQKIKSKTIKVVGYQNNHGKGHAVRYGIARSTGEMIAFIDAGMDLNPNGISMLLEHMEWYKADIIVGSKRHPASKVPSYPFIRKIYSMGYHILARLLFGLKLRDTQTGLKIFRREVLQDVLPRLLVKKFAFDVEILSVAYRLGYRRIFEAPIELDPKRFVFASTIKTSAVFDMLVDTLAIFYRLKILKYYDNRNKRKWIHDPDLNFKINIG